MRERTDVNWSAVLKARRKEHKAKEKIPKPNVEKLYGKSFMELHRKQMYKIHRDYIKHYYSHKRFSEGNKHRKAIEIMRLKSNVVFNEKLQDIGEDEEFLAIQQRKEKERKKRAKAYKKEYKAKKKLLPPGTTVSQQKRLGITPINPSKKLKEEKELERIKAWYRENMGEEE